MAAPTPNQELDLTLNGRTTESDRQQPVNQQQFMALLSKINDSTYAYPAVALVVCTIPVLFIFFSTMPTLMKILCVVILIAFIVFTVWKFRPNSTNVSKTSSA